MLFNYAIVIVLISLTVLIESLPLTSKNVFSPNTLLKSTSDVKSKDLSKRDAAEKHMIPSALPVTDSSSLVGQSAPRRIHRPNLINHRPTTPHRPQTHRAGQNHGTSSQRSHLHVPHLPRTQARNRAVPHVPHSTRRQHQIHRSPLRSRSSAGHRHRGIVGSSADTDTSKLQENHSSSTQPTLKIITQPSNLID